MERLDCNGLREMVNESKGKTKLEVDELGEPSVTWSCCETQQMVSSRHLIKCAYIRYSSTWQRLVAHHMKSMVDERYASVSYCAALLLSRTVWRYRVI